MVCPSDGFSLCRILYKACRSKKWYSRQYYLNRGQRIYYPCQSKSKGDYKYDRMHHYKQLEEELRPSKNFHVSHKDKVTKAYLRYTMAQMNHLKWSRRCIALSRMKISRMMGSLNGV